MEGSPGFFVGSPNRLWAAAYPAAPTAGLGTLFGTVSCHYRGEGGKCERAAHGRAYPPMTSRALLQGFPAHFPPSPRYKPAVQTACQAQQRRREWWREALIAAHTLLGLPNQRTLKRLERREGGGNARNGRGIQRGGGLRPSLRPQGGIGKRNAPVLKDGEVSPPHLSHNRDRRSPTCAPFGQASRPRPRDARSQNHRGPTHYRL